MYKTMKEKMFKIKDNKKGLTAIEMVIGVLIFIIMLSFMMDVLILFWKFSVISQTTTQVARVASIQGGVLEQQPRDWPSGDVYSDINTLNSTVQGKMNTASIDEWVVRIGSGQIGTQGVSGTGQIDYKNNFTVETTIAYRWNFSSNFIPGMDIEQNITARRPAMSEWKYNYEQWNGE